MKKKVVWVLYIGLALELLLVLVSWYETETLTTFFQSCARYSGRVSLLLFSIVFLAFPGNRHGEEKQKDQKHLVLYFAIVHVIHFGLLATYIHLSGNELIPIRLAGGAFAYLLIIVYPIVMNTKLSRKPWMSYFPILYYYYVWLVFFLSYLPRIRKQLPDVSGDLETYYFLFFYVIVLLAIQLILVRKYHQKHA